MRFVFLFIISTLTSCLPIRRLTFSPTDITAPTPKPISGYVLDSLTRQPVPGVLVLAYPRASALTDQQGHFSIAGKMLQPSGPYNLFVATLAYTGRVQVKNDIAQNVTLLISRRKHPYQFQPDSCRSVNNARYINPYATPTMAEGTPGSMYAFFVDNGRSSASATLRAITIRTTDLRHYLHDPFLPFRLRVFSMDSLTQQPGHDLLTENVILCLSRKNQTSSIDLSEYAIPAPLRGFYVAFEMLVQGDHFYTCPDTLLNYRPVGPVLGASCSFADTRSWLYTYQKQSWIRTPPEENCWPLYEQLFEVEVSQ